MVMMSRRWMDLVLDHSMVSMWDQKWALRSAVMREVELDDLKGDSRAFLLELGMVCKLVLRLGELWVAVKACLLVLKANEGIKKKGVKSVC